MPRISTDERFTRVLKFLLSMLKPEIASQMAQRGFDESDRAQGWELLERAAGRYMALAMASEANQVDKLLVAQIDRWENTWFDVAEAALTHLYPEVQGRLFLNLHKSTGVEVLLTVQTFLDRLDVLGAEQDEQSRAALALLDKRGLDQDQRDLARSFLEQATTSVPIAAVTVEPAALEEQQAAMAALWKWYKDWAMTARTVIDKKVQRITMGISKPRVNMSEEEIEAEEIEEEMIVSPSAATATAPATATRAASAAAPATA